MEGFFIILLFVLLFITDIRLGKIFDKMYNLIILWY